MGKKIPLEVLEAKAAAGKRNGRGKLTFADGSAYEGTWKDGDRDGPGKVTYSDGRVSVYPHGRPAPSIKREHEAPSDRPVKRNCNYGLDALANVGREVKKELCN